MFSRFASSFPSILGASIFWTFKAHGKILLISWVFFKSPILKSLAKLSSKNVISSSIVSFNIFSDNFCWIKSFWFCASRMTFIDNEKRMKRTRYKKAVLLDFLKNFQFGEVIQFSPSNQQNNHLFFQSSLIGFLLQ